jgi:hypothetical protein
MQKKLQIRGIFSLCIKNFPFGYLVKKVNVFSEIAAHLERFHDDEIVSQQPDSNSGTVKISWMLWDSLAEFSVLVLSEDWISDPTYNVDGFRGRSTSCSCHDYLRFPFPLNWNLQHHSQSSRQTSSNYSRKTFPTSQNFLHLCFYSYLARHHKKAFCLNDTKESDLSDLSPVISRYSTIKKEWIEESPNWAAQKNSPRVFRGEK